MSENMETPPSPTKPIDIPVSTPEPAPNQMDYLVKKMEEMESRIKQANEPKPKPKRKATEKQLENLKKAREKRAEVAVKRKEIKKELKIKEKKLENEQLKKMNSDIKEDVTSENVSIDVSDKEPPRDSTPSVTFATQPTMENNPNIPIIEPPRDENYHLYSKANIPQTPFRYGSIRKRR